MSEQTQTPSEEDLAHWDVMEEELDAMAAVDAELGTRDTDAPPDVGFWLEQVLAEPLAIDFAYEDFLPEADLLDRMDRFVHGALPGAASATFRMRLSAASAHVKQQVGRKLGLHTNTTPSVHRQRGMQVAAFYAELVKSGAQVPVMATILSTYGALSFERQAQILDRLLQGGVENAQAAGQMLLESRGVGGTVTEQLMQERLARSAGALTPSLEQMMRERLAEMQMQASEMRQQAPMYSGIGGVPTPRQGKSRGRDLAARVYDEFIKARKGR